MKHSPQQPSLRRQYEANRDGEICCNMELQDGILI